MAKARPIVKRKRRFMSKQNTVNAMSQTLINSRGQDRRDKAREIFIDLTDLENRNFN
jgi:hypothetical protein